MDRNKVGRGLLIIAGSVSVGLGAVGIIIPVLPTTPFLLLACFCFARSSHRLHDGLLRHKLFGKLIENYVKNRAVTRKTKIVTLVLLWTGLVISGVLVATLPVALILLAVGGGVTAHILSLRTI